MIIKHNCPNCNWFFANWQRVLTIMFIALIICTITLAFGAKAGLYTITFQGRQILP